MWGKLIVHLNALLRETQMLQTFTLRGDHLYQIAYFCIINSTKSDMQFNNFMVLNILR